MAITCCPLSGSADGGPSHSDTAIVRAKKNHPCTECGTDPGIPKGALHELTKGKWDGQWSQYRTCASCVEIRDHFACDGWIYGQIWIDLQENFYPEMKCGGPCMDGLSPEAKRRLIDDRMEWLFAQDEIDDSAWEGWTPDKPPSPPRIHPDPRTTTAEFDPDRPFSNGWRP